VTGVQFGLFSLTTLSSPRGNTAELLAETRAEVQLAEELEFDIAWFAEHHFSNYSITTSPLLLVADMAQATTRIRLGPAVVVLPFYEPLRLAEDVCLTDALTAGRLVLGLGFGYQPREFTKFGIPFDERYERGLEAWDLIDQAIEGKIDHQGEHVTAHVDVAVTAVQDRVPTFVVGSDPTVMQIVAKRRATPFVTPGLQPLSAAVRMRDAYADLYGEPMPFAMQRYVFVSDDKTERRQAAEQVRNVARMAGNLRRAEPLMQGAHLERPAIENEPSLDDIEAGALIGTAAQVCERIITEANALSLSHLSCFIRLADMPHDMAMRSIELFGREVIPAVHAELHGRETSIPAT
jgi:alkanesulfonate monooxygenase SsuD/methylene tetrahydromethanopterin reductase-like flavin-dependent oxidoreductase (luciferase family)